MSTTTKENSLYRIVTTHYIAAAICFLTLAVLLIVAQDALFGHYFHPKLLAVTHLAVLGWGSTIIFGASYQLLPVILEIRLFSYSLAWVSFGSFLTGMVLLVCAFWIFDPGLHMQIGATLLVTGMVLFAINIYRTASAKKSATTIEQEFIITSCVWLVATGILGALLVFNFRYPFLPKDHLQFLKLHAHAGIVGWFFLLIAGVSSKLLPMFLVSAKPAIKNLSYTYYLINASLILFLADTYLYGINYHTYFILAIAFGGLVAFLLYVRSCFATRVRKAIDLPMKNTALSFTFLLACIIVLPIIIKDSLLHSSLSVKYTTLYGTLLIMGWITTLILGQTFKTLPFIVWARAYEDISGKVKTPQPADLYSKWLLRVQTIGFILFCVLFFPGLAVSNRLLVQLGLFSFLFTAMMYTANVAKVLMHKSKL